MGTVHTDSVQPCLAAAHLVLLTVASKLTVPVATESCQACGGGHVTS